MSHVPNILREPPTSGALGSPRKCLIAFAVVSLLAGCSSRSTVKYVHEEGHGQPVPVDVKCADIEAPTLINRVDPDYPVAVRKDRIQGTVIAKCVIDLDGAVSDVQVRSSPSQTLSDLAVQAIRQWRYSPGYCKELNGPIRVYIYTAVTFSL